MSDITRLISNLFAQSTKQPNRAARRRMQRLILTRKQRALSLARTNENLNWAQPKKESV